MTSCKWVVCPRCDVVQSVRRSYVDYGGYLVTNCFQCEDGDSGAPYEIDIDGWGITDPTDEEIAEYVKRLGEKQ